VSVVDPANAEARVLVVDDEPNIVDVLRMSLEFVGFEVDVATNGRTAIAKVRSGRPDIVLLDVMLPDLDGFEVLKRLRADEITTPVVFLTARDTPADAVRGLTAGGDDYVAKPFSLEELVARVRAVLRRSRGEVTASRILRFSDLEMDDDRRTVTRGGTLVELSRTEYELLRYLMENAERVMSKSMILSHVWHYDFGGDSTVVETYVSYLRKKLDPLGPPLIQTVRGFGYTLREPSRSGSPG
jgi:two-component system OmpR family response regulator